MKLKYTPLFSCACLLIKVLQVNAATCVYSYDSLNRLTNAAYSDGSQESYSYDNAGNRLARIITSATIKVDNAPPSIPTNLVSLNFTPSQLNIGWGRSFDTGGSGLAGYQVFVNGTLVGTTTGTNFLLSGLMPNSQYCLSIDAFDLSTNISAQSTNICFTTPVFQPPFLNPVGIVNGQFQIGVTNGTVGPYEGWFSSNLFQWNLFTNFSLPVPGNTLFFPITGQSQQYYQLRWSTNGGNAP